jgi:putative hemolysin
MDLAIIFVLILCNGLFAMSEIAVVSARKARLQQRADEGQAGAAVALQLANEPAHFFSTIQVGITSIGILNGAFGEAAIADKLAVYFAEFPLLAPYSRGLALTVMVISITYLSVILGELVPKRLALINPEGIASVIARPMQMLARITAPLVNFLSLSSELVLRVLRPKPNEDPPVTEEEINVLMEQGEQAGVFEPAESALVSNVLRLDEQPVAAIMTPRVDMVYLDLDDPFEENRRKLIDSPHSTLPVCKGGLDHVVGVLRSQELLAKSLAGQPTDIANALHPPLYIPRSLSAMQVLETFKKHRAHIALVVDEYGNIIGLVSPTDILEAIVGEISMEEAEDADAVQREDGSWLMDGMLSTERFRQLLNADELPGEEGGNFHTLGGFLMMHLGRVPKAADHFEWNGLRFEVMDMDRNRVDKVLVTRLPNPSEDG